MVSPHLEAERDLLLQLIQAIRDSGSVAPINVWISPAPKGEHIYYKLSDTAAWVAQNLALKLPHVAIALYAGADQSKLFREGVWARVEREDVKKAVKAQQVRLLVATDAACEGLNLQTLGP